MAQPMAPLALADTAYDDQKGWRKGQHMIDALPYIDDPPPEVRRQVDSLVAEEMERSIKRPQDYLKELPMPGPVFLKNPMLAAEYERVKQRQPMPALDVVRYQLQPPPLSRRNDYAAWKAAVDNAHAQLEHQYLRILNLEILLKYGANNWRAQNQLTEVTNKGLEEEVATLKARTDQLNKERKLQQIEAGQKLADLEQQWMELLYKNIAIEKACSQLERQVDGLQQQLTLREQAAAAAAAVQAQADGVARQNGTQEGPHKENGAAQQEQEQQQQQEQQQEHEQEQANGPHSNGAS